MTDKLAGWIDVTEEARRRFFSYEIDEAWRQSRGLGEIIFLVKKRGWFVNDPAFSNPRLFCGENETREIAATLSLMVQNVSCVGPATEYRRGVLECVAWVAANAHNYKPETLAESMANDLARFLEGVG